MTTKILSPDAQLIKVCESNLTAPRMCPVIGMGLTVLFVFSQKEVCMEVFAWAGVSEGGVAVLVWGVVQLEVGVSFLPVSLLFLVLCCFCDRMSQSP